MSDMRVWFITGASRGMGTSFARAALEAGETDRQRLATGGDDYELVFTVPPDRVAAALAAAEAAGGVPVTEIWRALYGCSSFDSASERLLVAALDVTSQDEANAAVAAGVERFGRIDVVVNSAGASFKGYFEEMSPRQVEQQLSVNLVGPMNVARAVLPVMRLQRSGHLIAISSGAALMGFEYSSVYAASKAGLEGWMSALAHEVEPYGIHTTIVNPGFFRTGLASPESLVWPELSIDDYAERSAAQRAWWLAQDGRQAGDPAKLAAALIALSDGDPPPRRFIAGADVIALAQQRIELLQQDVESHRTLSESLTFDE